MDQRKEGGALIKYLFAQWHRKVSIAISISFALLVTISYQNCGKGFKSINQIELASTGPGAFSTPTIKLLQPLPEITNQAAVSLRPLVEIGTGVSLKSLTCQLDNKAAEDCSLGDVSYLNLSDGDHQIRIEAEDSRGQKANPLIVLFRVDTIAPTIEVSQTPSAVSAIASPEFVFLAKDNLGIDVSECSLDNNPWSVCMSPYKPANLTAQTHTLKIRAKDKAKNLSAEYTYTWVIDTTAPVVTISSGPKQNDNSVNATFAFGSNDNTSTLECQIDTQAFSSCDPRNSQTYTNLAEGEHTFSLRAKDLAGNYSVPLIYRWKIDTTPPSAPSLMHNLTLNQVGSLSYSNSENVSFNFNSTDTNGVVSYLCSRNGATPTECSSPKNYAPITQGQQNFEVLAVDAATNKSPSTLLRWTVDLTPPTTSISRMPALSTFESSASFTFLAADDRSGVARSECQLDELLPTACTPGQALNFVNLSLATHSFQTRSFDHAGNVSNYAKYSWTIETPVRVTIQDGVVVEQGSNAQIQLSLDRAQSKETTVKLMIYQGKFDYFTDFEAGEIPVVFAPSQTVATVTVRTFLARGLTEDKTVILTPSPYETGVVGDSATLTIKPSSAFNSLKGVPSVSFGVGFGCAVKPTGRVVCWGRFPGIDNPKNQPLEVAGITQAVKVSAGSVHACALITGGIIKCWGANTYGQLGNGTSSRNVSQTFAPTEVVQARGAIDIESFGLSSCAVMASGSLKCWGENSSSTGLFPTTHNMYLTPTEVPNLSNVKQFSAGTGTFCSLHNDGSVRCWKTGESTPKLMGLNGIKSISASQIVCGINTRNLVVCQAIGGASPPYQLDRIADIKYLAVGSDNSVCGVNTSGNVLCEKDATFPQRNHIPEINDSSGILAYGSIRCSYGVNGYLRCWGATQGNEFGNTPSIARNYPVSIPELYWKEMAIAVARDASDQYFDDIACGLSITNAFVCLLKDSLNFRPLNILLGSALYYSVTSMDFGMRDRYSNRQFGACVVLSKGEVNCISNGYIAGDGTGGNSWGLNSENEISLIKTYTVSDINNAVEVVTNSYYACARTKLGAVKCWGNTREASDPTTSNIYFESYRPLDIANISDATKIVMGRDFGCALLASKTVRCWGGAHSGGLVLGNNFQNPQGTVATAVTVSNLSNVIDIAAQKEHVYAVTAEGELYCWGKCTSTGLPELFIDGPPSAPVPVRLASSAVFTQVATGDFHGCALDNKSEVYCWGDAQYGSLGGKELSGRGPAGNSPILVSTPTLVDYKLGVPKSRISAKSNSTCFYIEGRPACTGGLNSLMQIRIRWPTVLMW